MVRILVADDDPCVARLVTRALSEVGYEVQCARDGVGALAALRQQPFDLVLLDVTMPNLDGYQVCLKMRHESIKPRVGVLFLTAHAQLDDVLSAFDAGADDYLTKPFRIPELFQLCARLLDLPVA